MKKINKVWDLSVTIMVWHTWVENEWSIWMNDSYGVSLKIYVFMILFGIKIKRNFE